MASSRIVQKVLDNRLNTLPLVSGTIANQNQIVQNSLMYYADKQYNWMATGSLNNMIYYQMSPQGYVKKMRRKLSIVQLVLGIERYRDISALSGGMF